MSSSSSNTINVGASGGSGNAGGNGGGGNQLNSNGQNASGDNAGGSSSSTPLNPPRGTQQQGGVKRNIEQAVKVVSNTHYIVCCSYINQSPGGICILCEIYYFCSFEGTVKCADWGRYAVK